MLISAERPRLLVTPETLPLLKERAAANDPAFVALRRMCDSTLAGTRDGLLVPNHSLMYLVTGDAKYAEAALFHLQKYLHLGMNAITVPRTGLNVREVLFRAALFYDWCSGGLDPLTLEDVRLQMEDWADWVWPETNPERRTAWGINRPGDNFFAAFMCGVWMTGLALHLDSPKAGKYIDLCKTRWTRRMRPYLEAKVQGGFLHEGTTYGSGTLWRTLMMLQAHATATDERLGGSWPSDALGCLFQCTAPDRRHFCPFGAQTADVEGRGAVNPYHAGCVLLGSAYSISRDKECRQWLAEVQPAWNRKRWTLWEWFLFGEPGEREPVRATWHESKGAGYMTSRSSREKDAVQVQFLCGPQGQPDSGNHNDWAAGEFVVIRGGDWLVAKAGMFSTDGGLHPHSEKNNCITVNGLSQPIEGKGGKPVLFRDTEECALMVGEAGAAYDYRERVGGVWVDRKPLKLWLRQVLFLKPNAIILWDRVDKRETETEVRWYLNTHGPSLSSVGASQFGFKEGESWLEWTRLLPEGQIRQESLHLARAPEGQIPPATTYRSSVAPRVPRASDLFLNVLQVGKAGFNPDPVSLIRCDTVGWSVLVGGRRIACNRDGEVTLG